MLYCLYTECVEVWLLSLQVDVLFCDKLGMFRLLGSLADCRMSDAVSVVCARLFFDGASCCGVNGILSVVFVGVMLVPIARASRILRVPSDV